MTQVCSTEMCARMCTMLSLGMLMALPNCWRAGVEKWRFRLEELSSTLDIPIPAKQQRNHQLVSKSSLFQFMQSYNQGPKNSILWWTKSTKFFQSLDQLPTTVYSCLQFTVCLWYTKFYSGPAIFSAGGHDVNRRKKLLSNPV